MAILYVTINGNTYSTGTTDEGTGVKFLDAGGHWDHFLPLVEDIVTIAADITANIGEVATSTSSLAIGTGSKTFTTQAGIPNFQVGNWVKATSAANEANYMYGQITSYSSTTLIVNITDTGGSGTLADWEFRMAGAKGATGPAGAVDATAQTGLLKGNGSVISAAVSGTDIKTVNSTSLLGSGDIPLYSKAKSLFLAWS